MTNFGARMWRRKSRRMDRKPNKKRREPRRKPLPPPIGDETAESPMAVVPFHLLPVHVQVAQASHRRRYDPSDE